MIEEVNEIICKECLVQPICGDPCDLYCEVFNPVYKEMKLIEERIERKLHPSEVKQLAVNSAKRFTIMKLKEATGERLWPLKIK